jgi:hypothetical protein
VAGELFPDLLEELQLIPALLGERHRIVAGETSGAVAVSILPDRGEKAFLGEVAYGIGAHESVPLSKLRLR